MCKMRVLARSAAGRFSGSHSSILLLPLIVWLHGVILSQFSAGTIVSAARVHVREMELQRSLSRYRQLLEYDNSRPDLVEPQEEQIRPEQEKQKETKSKANGSVESPVKDVEEYQAVQGVELEVRKDDETEVKENENLNSEKIEELKGDQETKADNHNRAKDKQKRKKSGAKDNKESEEKQQDKTEELKLNTDEGSERQVADEVNTDETNEGNEPKVDNVGKAKEGEPSAKAEEQQDQGGEQKTAEIDKTGQQSDSNTEITQQGEEREEPEVKTEEQQAEERESKTEENKSGERKESELKTDKEKTEERKESESKSAEEKTQERQDSESNAEEQKTEEREGASEFKTEEEKLPEEEPFVFPEPYLLGSPIKDWDEQRGSWLDANPHMKSTSEGKPRVLIITGSQPDPCRSLVGDNFNLKSLKLKIDYARMHNYELYYNFAWLDPLFGSFWVKLPILRKLMLTHPEIEWFLWIDSDAVFTDLTFEAPFHTYEGYNMIMWGWNHGFFVDKSWVAFNAGVFIIRNCQWTLDLIDKWSPMGPDGPVRDEYGKMLSDFLSNRDQNYPADDQSALAYLILTDEAVKSKVKLIELSEYMVSAWWVEVVDNFETSMEKYHPGLGDYRWPWITHFTGCGPCNGDNSNPIYEKCMKNIERAFNFADNQVLAYMGFQHESLSSDSLVRIRNETDRPLEFVGVNPWEERIAQVAAAAR